MTYRIINGTLEHVEQTVEKYLSAGYVLHGPLIYTGDDDVDAFAQAVLFTSKD